MEMDRAHTTKTSVKHHQTSFDLEPSQEEEKRQAKEHLVTGSPGRHPETGIHLPTSHPAAPQTLGRTAFLPFLVQEWTSNGKPDPERSPNSQEIISTFRNCSVDQLRAVWRTQCGADQAYPGSTRALTVSVYWMLCKGECKPDGYRTNGGPIQSYSVTMRNGFVQMDQSQWGGRRSCTQTRHSLG
ncbi:hypothetical protein SKAU_G00256510 [Synaphobranchus kaupii]|uniref:Uncharacterized protein n=1 Tax=Synaphobranchus kaupii TaxID=118154 RepID=A0A9Q1F3Y9_SYNKA|nr:hypothetical protein SKAU_G00256510 [Synaphobranchus kaupii]